MCMDKSEVIKYLKIERECISRDCDRNCGECDLVQEQETLLDAYNSAIALIEDIKFKTPIGYTTNGIFYKSGS